MSNANEELRFLPDQARLRLISVLDAGDGWRKLLHLITHPDDPTRTLFNADHARVLENETRRSRTDEILKTWSTTGRNRPTIADLLAVLKKGEQNRAASIILIDVLKETPVDDQECDGFLEQLDLLPTAPPLSRTNECSTNAGSELQDGAFQFPYSVLARATGNFCDIPVSEGGSKVGEGAFGIVYKGILPDGTVVAVKRLKEAFPDQFWMEVRLLQRHPHPNLLPLVGVANDSRHSCIVYKFMEYGSLQSCLARENNVPPMYWEKRISILTEIAAAINFLHTRTPTSFVHRDVKSANVLLDEKWTAKLGDFGLARALPGDGTTRTEVVVGTTVYMAPESILGIVTPKMDTYSFGVLIMEILTALPPYVTVQGQREDIISYLSETYPDDIAPALDNSGGEWNVELARKVHKIAETCVNPDRRKRPYMQPVYDHILELHDIMLSTPPVS